MHSYELRAQYYETDQMGIISPVLEVNCLIQSVTSKFRRSELVEAMDADKMRTD